MRDKLEVLDEYFGHQSFRPGQEQVIDAVLDEKNDGVLCVMPTGGGKSLIYQLPSIMCDGMTIVVSPLISLMKDQVDALHKNGIDAAFYNSTQTKSEQEGIISSINLGLVDLLYISPERFHDDYFIDFLKEQDIGLFAVDEAHLISQWGHDFRPSYRYLRDAIKTLKPSRVVALTATATVKVQDDICMQLGIPGAKRFVQGFYRDNLVIDFNECSKHAKVEVVSQDVKDFVDQGFTTGIVYGLTREYSEKICETLNEKYDVPAQFYHAGMSDKERKEVQNEWSENGGIIVATCAFGMGIDRPDVRFVLHAGLPGSIEAWYQEIGRAGRDGQDAYCRTYFDPIADPALQQWFIKIAMPPVDDIEKFWRWISNEVKCEGTNIVDKIQSVMQKESGVRYVSGCIGILKKHKVITTLKRGQYRLDKMYGKSPIDWREYRKLRSYKYDMLQQLVDLASNRRHCRMLQVLEYFGDTSRTAECHKCDVCG